MSVGPGTRIGPYEVLSPLGAGGMGEVYRARDTKLNRDVALKILPADLALDSDRRARFGREAQLLASLNHPNIAAIYGLEDTGDTHALVLELVEGETLADRIARSPVPLDEALAIARQICEALEAAHEHGVIHRDLKPANVKVRSDGTVKVLDFGLAKLSEPPATPSIPNIVSLSPTITSPALLTGVGVLLGTAAYMAPEQARGKAVDKRVDVWSLGCVLFEMIAGRRPFAGDEAADVIISALTKDPEWSRLPPTTPGRLRQLLEKCLTKEPRERLRDVGDARLLIADVGSEKLAPDGASRGASSRGRWRRIAVQISTVVMAASIGGIAIWVRTQARPTTGTMRLTIAPAGSAALTIGGADRDIALSADGTKLVYVGANGTQLFVRAFDQIDPKPIDVVGGAGIPHHPLVSPDGEWIAFFDGISALKRVSINGGPPVTICRVNAVPQGLTWGRDGTIVFATIANPGLFSVSASGGEPAELATPDAQLPGAFYEWPEFLPGDRAILFTVSPSTATTTSQIAVLDLASHKKKVLIQGGSAARYVRGGYLVYSAGETMRAVRFDTATLQVVGTPVPLQDRPLMNQGVQVANLDVASNGTMAYLPSTATVAGRSLVWVDRSGHEEPINAPVRAYVYPRLSPDGKRIAFDVRDQETDIWTWDVVRQTFSRFTFGPAYEGYPLWSPDGRGLIFSSSRFGPNGIYRQSADGAGAVEKLSAGSNNRFPYTMSPDGRLVVFREDVPGSGQDLMLLDLGTSESRIEPLLQTTANELNAEISPDGRWLAYESDESGQSQVYVRAFPDRAGARWQISTAGGTRPLWARDGRELFFIDRTGALMDVSVEHESAASFTPGMPVKLLDGRYYVGGSIYVGRTYDVSPDGRRFLMMKLDSMTPTSIVVVLNWTEELKRLLPSR